MRKILKEIFNLSYLHKNKLYLSIILSVFDTIFIIAPVIVAYMILGSIPQINPLTNTPLTSQMVINYSLILLACIIARIIVRYFVTRLRSNSAYEVLSEKRKEIGKELRKVSMGYFSKKNTGDLVSTITSDASFLELVGMGIFEKITNGVLVLLVGLTFLTILNYKIAIVVAIIFIPIYFIYKWMSGLQEKLDLNRQDDIGAFTEDTVEFIKGMHIIKSFNMLEKQSSRIKDSFKKIKEVDTKIELSHLPSAAILQFFFRIITIAVILLSTVFMISGKMTYQTAATLMLSSFTLFNAVETMSIFGVFLRLAQVSISRMNSVNKIPKMDNTDGKEKIDNCEICFENVSFSYDTVQILNDISFKVKENSTTALVGMSGSGKTTITNLVARFWDINKGQILIGDKNIKTINYENLLHNISFVFQDVFLFDDTILNNVRIGRPEAQMSEIISVCKRAGCHDFIMQLKDGYETMVGEGGDMLSGGEKQRISIARALIKDAPIVLLDEVTANVDVENEQRIQVALNELLKDRTVIMIAHKLFTIKDVEQILVIEDGKINQRGTHDKLVNEKGLYNKLWNMQSETSNWKF